MTLAEQVAELEAECKPAVGATAAIDPATIMQLITVLLELWKQWKQKTP